MQPHLKSKVEKLCFILQFVGCDCTKSKVTRSGLKNKYRKPLDSSREEGGKEGGIEGERERERKQPQNG